MVFPDGHHIFRTRLFEQLNPAVRLPAFRFEHRDEILITKNRLRAILPAVIIKSLFASKVHVPRVPLVVIGRHGIHAPVQEDAELGVPVPIWYPITA